MDEFKEICNNGFKILRSHADTIVTLLNLMLCTDIPELTKQSISIIIVLMKKL